MYTKNVSKISGILMNISLAVFFAVLPFVSLAQQPGQGNVPPPQDQSGRIVNPIDSDTVQEFIKTILEGVVKIGLPVIALAIIFSGFMFVFARGNSEKLTKARQSLIYTLIGAALLLGAWSLAQLISETVRAL